MNEYLITTILFISAYILGAVPFAHIFTKLFTKKDIMQIGWKKSSSSNVLANIGVFPAFLTFVFDVFKGFIIIYIANKLGLSLTVQAIIGFLTVIGHNWSIFLDFKGGRGIATLLGACLVLNPIVSLVLLFVVILFAAVWTASIGTILAYLSGMVWAYLINEYGLFLLFFLCLIPIIIKRLSPISSLKGHVVNRLLFDQNNVPPLRIGNRNKPL